MKMLSLGLFAFKTTQIICWERFKFIYCVLYTVPAAALSPCSLELVFIIKSQSFYIKMQIKGAIKSTSRAVWLLRQVGFSLHDCRDCFNVSRILSCKQRKWRLHNYFITIALTVPICYFHFLFSWKLQLFQQHLSLVSTISELSCLEEVLKKELSLKSAQIILEWLYNLLWTISVGQFCSDELVLNTEL